MKRADVVVLGGGHNGLTAAAYLARAGRSVTVVEALPQVGGTVSTEEFAPGFRASSVFPSAETFHPGIVRELELEGHGLRWLRPSTSVLVPLPDGGALRVPASRNGGGRLEVDAADGTGRAGRVALDAEALREFDAFLGRVARVVEPVLTRPLPRLEPEGVGDVFDLLKIGLKLRGLGRREMPEAMRLLPMCLRDALDERFTDEALKAALALQGLRATWLAPRSPGGALGLVYHRPAWTPGLLAPPAFVEGGLGRLSGALAEAARQAGAEILTATRATAIRVDGGRAVAVEVEGDEGTFELGATALVSALHPKTTLLRLVEPGWLDPEIATALDAMRSRGTVAVVKLALQGLPSFPGVQAARATSGDAVGGGRDPGASPANGAGALSGRVQIGHRLDDLERAFDAVKYGQLPQAPVLDITFPSILDASLAPEGKQVAHVWVQYVPHRLEDGDWSTHRDELGDVVLRTLESAAPGFGAAVLHRHVLTPADLEERYGLVDGCPHHAELALDQVLYMRPIPGWYRHRTPIDGLYLCGPGTHPGGGVTGLPGRNAARRVLADWKDGALGNRSG